MRGRASAREKLSVVAPSEGEVLVHGDSSKNSSPSAPRPRSPQQEAEGARPVASEPQALSEGSPARRARVLIIDDEPRLVQSMRLLLQPYHDVVATTRGSEALEKVRSGQDFDIIICDLQMPDMTGAEVYARLNAQAPELLRRLVFISGGACTPTTLDFVRKVSNPVLEKPVRPEVLLATIDRALPPLPTPR